MIGAALPRTQPTGADVTLRFTGVEIYRVCERWREAREKSGGGEGASLCSNSNQVGRVDAGWICPTRRELPQTCTPESLSMVGCWLAVNAEAHESNGQCPFTSNTNFIVS
jgi:hypothetical protein